LPLAADRPQATAGLIDKETSPPWQDHIFSSQFQLFSYLSLFDRDDICSPQDLARLSLDPSTNVVSYLSDLAIPFVSKDMVGGVDMDGDRAKGPMADPRRLREKLTKILDKNPIGLSPEGSYLPGSELKELLTLEAVRGALGGNDDTLAHFALQKAPKSFATLLLVFSDCENLERAMKRFQTADFTDEKLWSTAFEVPSPALELCEEHNCKRNSGTCLHHFPFHEPWDVERF
jgi:hypothetical protein